jgi:hypothetical protein
MAEGEIEQPLDGGPVYRALGDDFHVGVLATLSFFCRRGPPDRMLYPVWRGLGNGMTKVLRPACRAVRSSSSLSSQMRQGIKLLSRKQGCAISRRPGPRQPKAQYSYGLDHRYVKGHFRG